MTVVVGRSLRQAVATTTLMVGGLSGHGAVSSARVEQHLDPRRTRRDLLPGILGAPAFGEADAHGVRVDGADAHAVGVPYPVAVRVAGEYV